MYTDVKLEKGLYSISGKTFTQALEAADPDSNYEGTPLEGLDAFERQLKRFDIKVSGADCDRVEKFFVSTESAVLFPEYVRRQIKAGMDEASLLGEITASVTRTDSIDFRSIKVTETGTDSNIAQGAELASTVIKLANNTTPLNKFGRKISFTYETIRKQRIETLGILLRAAGAKLSVSINNSIISWIVANVVARTYSGTMTYAHLSDFWASMSNHCMDVMIASPKTISNILGFDQVKYSISDLTKSGRIKTPFGVTLIANPTLIEGMVIGIDSSCGLEAIFGSDIVVDFDKLISTQYEEVAVSVLFSHSLLCADAVSRLTKAAG